MNDNHLEATASPTCLQWLRSMTMVTCDILHKGAVYEKAIWKTARRERISARSVYVSGVGRSWIRDTRVDCLRQHHERWRCHVCSPTGNRAELHLPDLQWGSGHHRDRLSNATDHVPYLVLLRHCKLSAHQQSAVAGSVARLFERWQDGHDDA